MQRSVRLKKILAVLIIAVFVIVELLLAFTLIYTLVDENQDKMTVLPTLFCMGMMAFPLWYGARLWKSAIPAPTPNPAMATVSVPDPAVPPDALKIQTKLGLPDYRKLIFRLSYTSPALLWVYLIGLMFLVTLLTNGQGQSWFVLFIVLFLLYMPFAVYRGANANYKSSKSLHEVVTYAFTAENIIAYGESFNFTIHWASLYKIREVGQWLLLYQNKQIAMIIDKHAFASTAELEAVKQMARNHNIR